MGAVDRVRVQQLSRSSTVGVVKPADLTALRIPGRPALSPQGEVLVAVSSPDLQTDSYRSALHWYSAAAAEPSRPFTFGEKDSAPVFSPDGETVVFLRAVGDARPQLFAMPVRGGEARRLTDHPLGAGAATFSADGQRIVYLAAVPEAGRYGTDDQVTADAEPPRRIRSRAYRYDGRGFLLDQPDQVFVITLAADLAAGPGPVQVTDEPTGAAGPVFAVDGSVLYVRDVAEGRLDAEIVAVPVPGPGDVPAAPGSARLVTRPGGSVAVPVVAGDTLLFCSVQFAGFDAGGRTTGLWAVPVAGGPARRLTDEASVDVDIEAGRPVVVGGHALVAVLDRGSVGLRAVPLTAEQAALADLPTVSGGHRAVKSFAAQAHQVVAVVADPVSPGELVLVEVDAQAHPVGSERRLTDLATGLAEGGIAPQIEIFGRSPDGYPVHGWLVLPAGPGPHPVLLDVHGGPHSAYTWGWFDEAQVYAGAGYAVVLPNPRGSAGYGQAHGRSLIGRLGTIDADDVLALLDAALQRPDLDAARVGVLGGSYGGFMTSWLASHAPERFVAAISERALNAWDSFVGSSDIGYFFAESYVGTDRERQWSSSPLAYADQIAVPLLIIHSEKDWRCPIEQAQRLFVALMNRGADVEMLIFPGEGHELSRSGRPRHRLARFEAILDWWRRYLPVAGPALAGDPGGAPDDPGGGGQG